MRIASSAEAPEGSTGYSVSVTRTPVDLFEQNAAGATWALGWDLCEDDQSRRTDGERKNITLNLRGESVEIDGVGFSSTGSSLRFFSSAACRRHTAIRN